MKRKGDACDTLHCSRMLAGLDGSGLYETQGSDTAPEPERALLRSFVQMMELKRLYRQGWLKRGVNETHCESVADHVFGTAMLVLLLAGRSEYAGLDRDRAIRIALVHELGEVYTGDITPVDGVSAAEKHRRERESLDRVLGSLDCGGEIRELWVDFEAGTSAEARFVRELDRLEMGLQARAYAVDGSEGMQEFYDSARRSVRSGSLARLLEAGIGGS